MESKWLVWSLVGLGIILLVLNLFIGGDSAPVTTSTEITQGENLPVDSTPVTTDIVVTQGENPLSNIWQSAFSEENRWIVSIAVVVALIAIIVTLMRYSGVNAGALGRTSITVIGYLVLGVMIVLFKLLPTDVIVYFSGIIMLILGGMVLLSLVMIVTGWGNKLAWVVLLVGFGVLMFNPAETTTTWVTETARTIQEEGLKGVAPKVTPLVPDFIYTSPEEKAAAALAAANLRAAEAKATEAERLLEAKVAGAERAAYDAEVARNAPLTEAAFMTRTAGEFLPIKIKKGERIGPIKQYAACDFHWSKSGFGMLKILTQPLNHKGLPIEATLADTGYSIKETGHPSQLIDVMFFEAVAGDIQLEMERIDNGTNTRRPCK